MNAIEMLRYFNIELEKEDFNRAGDELIALCPFHKEKIHPFSSMLIRACSTALDAMKAEI